MGRRDNQSDYPDAASPFSSKVGDPALVAFNCGLRAIAGAWSKKLIFARTSDILIGAPAV